MRGNGRTQRSREGLHRAACFRHREDTATRVAEVDAARVERDGRVRGGGRLGRGHREERRVAAPARHTFDRDDGALTGRGEVNVGVVRGDGRSPTRNIVREGRCLRRRRIDRDDGALVGVVHADRHEQVSAPMRDVCDVLRRDGCRPDALAGRSRIGEVRQRERQRRLVGRRCSAEHDELVRFGDEDAVRARRPHHARLRVVARDLRAALGEDNAVVHDEEQRLSVRPRRDARRRDRRRAHARERQPHDIRRLRHPIESARVDDEREVRGERRRNEHRRRAHDARASVDRRRDACARIEGGAVRSASLARRDVGDVDLRARSAGKEQRGHAALERVAKLATSIVRDELQVKRGIAPFCCHTTGT